MTFFKSNLRDVIALHQQMGVAAVRAAALVVEAKAKRNVRGGFRGRYTAGSPGVRRPGTFASGGESLPDDIGRRLAQSPTGRLMRDISHEVVPGLRPLARVGATVDYGLYWELGHHNVLIRRFVRFEWLRPAFTKTTEAQQAAAIAAIRDIASRGGLAARLGAAILG